MQAAASHPPADTPAPWRAVVVLGAGRSGTSAITRGLQALGVDLGERLRPGRGKNPTGFFEDQDLLRLNRRLKRRLGIRGDSVALIDAAQWDAPAVRALQAEAVALIRRRFADRALWGYKYGRTLRMLPFWEAVYRALDLDVRYVVALRNPLSVARSRGKLDPRRGTREKSDLEWLVNVVPYMAMVRARPFVVVDYDLVMADPRQQLRRVAARLELPVNAETEAGIEHYATRFLRPGMRHSRFTIDDLARTPGVHPLVRDAYGWLYRLATDELAPDDAGLWRDWARIEREVIALAPVLRHIDAVEAELRRARVHPAGPLQAIPHLWRRLRRG
ncbi:MAG: hypothetical protein D6826_11405 [Alphaproteobacteria bacterium]|nr:MAG: hypothetical protein D6826_11405 [Alphaproteobacteria bacterium]